MTPVVAELSVLESDCVGGDELDTASTVGTSTHSVCPGSESDSNV